MVERIVIERASEYSDPSLDFSAEKAETLPLTADQCAVLDQRLSAYALDGNRGRLSTDVLADLRQRL